MCDKALRQDDGGLGWSRRSESFVLGLRVVYAAECMLVLRRAHGIKDVESVEIRKRLLGLWRVGKEKGLHPMWLWEMERVLRRDVAKGFAKVGRTLAAMEA